MCHLSESGFSLDWYNLQFLVKPYLDKFGRIVKKFHGNLPGRESTRSFLKRHTILSEKFSSNTKRKRADIGLHTITEYFNYLKEELENVDPDNVFNFGKTNLTDNQGSKPFSQKWKQVSRESHHYFKNVNFTLHLHFT